MPIQIKVLPVTPFQQNCSMVWDTNTMEGVFVDPGGESEKLMQVAKEAGVKITQIWLTHGHMDHAGGALSIKESFGIDIIGPHKDDQFWLDMIEQAWEGYGQAGMGRNCTPDQYLNDGDVLTLGSTEFAVAHCPGHTPGHVVIYNQALKIAFVGDVLFKGSIGRTDFPKGDHQQLLGSIRDKLWPLGNDMRFLPGHGPMSTFGDERRSNPFVADHIFGQSGGRSTGVM